ncbi:MAG: glutamine synthetase type III, partial [Bacteroidales bacterium]|nr:glutamine synthetase type III [Bacteroidales bacterium]
VFGDEAAELGRASAKTFRQIAGLINSLSDGVAALVEERRKANRIPDMSEKARLYSTAVMDAMNRVREDADKLEMLVDDAFWPLPKYRELLYL